MRIVSVVVLLLNSLLDQVHSSSNPVAATLGIAVGISAQHLAVRSVVDHDVRSRIGV